MFESAPKALLSRAWYGASISEFVATDVNQVLGCLVANSEFTVLPTQRDAWVAEILVLRSKLIGLSGWVYLEFNIPRMGRRVDAILLIGPVVFVVEFKVGERNFDRAAIDQVWDYALDLKNFHEASHEALIVPVLFVTSTSRPPNRDLEKDTDGVYRPICTNNEGLREVIESVLKASLESPNIPLDWARSLYRPTPTIIEAARTLFAQHSVEAIARSDAGAQNLHLTSRRLEEVVDEARKDCLKVICFVTGVPGAGKTLVGLNVATQRRREGDSSHAVFLSGNAPLVSVLREALTRDEVQRRKAIGQNISKGEAGKSVKSFIQNVHHFRDEGLKHSGPPPEHVVIFDEAQRAWNLKQTASFMQRKKGCHGFSQSEPEFLISYMDRHADWAVIICLVGGGQEINVGEAGIGAWLDAVSTRFRHWQLHISPRLTDSEYAAGRALELVHQFEVRPYFDDSLHLAVAMRSFRAENVSAFVKALLDCDKSAAQSAYVRFSKNFPLVMTRDLDAAKQWIRSHARGSERYGLVASSKSMRLKPHAIDIRVSIDPIPYFLNDRDDVRSSFYMEDAATEFQVQGLELDWVCVAWDADLRSKGIGWSYHDFRGSDWCNIGNEDNRNYLRNAYRVLLTRARQGMVIFIPPGDSMDRTRQPEFYDSSYDYLKGIGIPEISI